MSSEPPRKSRSGVRIPWKLLLFLSLPVLLPAAAALITAPSGSPVLIVPAVALAVVLGGTPLLFTGYRQARAAGRMVDDFQKISGSKMYVDAIIENMLDTLVVLDAEYRITMVNDSLLTLLGHTAGELNGKPVASIFGNEVENPFNLPISELLIEKGVYKNYETFYMTREGKSVPILFNCSLIRETNGAVKAIICTGRNMASIKAARALLKTQRDWLEVTLASIGDGVIATDSEGNIIYMNAAAEKMTGSRLSEAEGTSLGRVLDINPALADRVLREFGECVITGRAGRAPAHLEWHSSPITGKKGERAGTIIILHDVTERKLAEEKLDGMQDQLIQSEKFSAIGRLSAGIAHEINNPAGYMISNLSMLKDYWPKVRALWKEVPGADEALMYILHDIPAMIEETLEGALKIKEIIGDVMEYAHPDRGEQRLTDLNKVLEKSIVLVWNELKYKCRLDKQLEGIPLVSCNPNQMEQVFLNLLLNAVQAVTTGEGEISVKSRQDGDEAVITICDNGAGIAAEYLDRIFEPFFTTKESAMSMGLGLAISYSIVTRHHGRIEVESVPGKGSTFTISLPAAGGTGG
jgi:PAS domain S-box-containing protein